MKKIIGTFVCILLIATVVPITTAVTIKQNLPPINSGVTFYVGGNGPVNYTRIQDAINNSSDGDTVFVYSGIYYENIHIDKEIFLVGEDKDVTLIDGRNSDDVLIISANDVKVSGFTIQNSGNSGRDAGIEIISEYNTISGNIIIDNTIGIFIYHSFNNTIMKNIIYQNKDYGIHLFFSHENSILDNNIYENRWGVFLFKSKNNIISDNTVNSNFHDGIWLDWGCNRNSLTKNTVSSNDGNGIRLLLWCDNNIISENTIDSNQEYGLFLKTVCNNNNISKNTISSSNSLGIFITEYCTGNNILCNNFQDNENDAYYIDSVFNNWNENYWGKARSTPKPIYGGASLVIGFNNDNHPIPAVVFDRNPAQEPYEIPMKNKNISFNTPKLPNDNKNTKQSDNLPSTFSWNNINGIDYTTRIKNQHPAPTCEAYALCAAIETLVQYQIGNPFDCDLSETHLYFNSGGTVDNGGVQIMNALEYLENYGVPDEGCFPDPHRGFDGSFESLLGWEDRTVKINEWGWVENDIDAIKQALIEHGPLVIHINVRYDFFHYKEGIYNPGLLSEKVTGHLVTLIGYDDIEQCWIIKNEWGSKWGEDGYVRISYDADSADHNFIVPNYGGTGILYIDGVYGNLQPSVPKINIEYPKIYHTYLLGREISTLNDIPTVFQKFKGNTLFQEGAPRIIGGITVKANTIDADEVEFYVDGVLQYTNINQPYEWGLDASFGLHTIETIAYNENGISKDIIDIFVYI